MRCRPDHPLAHRNVETIRCLVGRNLGWSLMIGHPRSDVTYDGGRLAFIEIADELPDNGIVLLHPGSRRTAKQQMVVDYVTSDLVVQP
ncbi:hypothetical protein EK0264_06775 [Epidermidibacterium keratini]|uniref:LysR substrate-binding domain-containing protein n=1 Tax=Epidermidibacterium keratini TaxID=1891644 RepID=A0A7L4YLK4_9ACTN|nr:hypothetical protein [Epidermidibacterium keratini]QHC00010.1 hypothetical protein EK0264_06775 [Epidermidibacterium keratini]